MLTLDEAIKHCHEKARELRGLPFKEEMEIEDIADCEECAEEHEQLAGWLTELKERREADSSPLKEDLVSYCKGLEDGRKLGDKE